MSITRKMYLGDGVYASWDYDYSLTLQTSNGVEVTNEIFLDLYVWEALLAYVKSCTDTVGGGADG